MQKFITGVKLLSVHSTFAANYQYLSFKYGLTEADWNKSLDHLLGKVKKKIALFHPQPVLCGVLNPCSAAPGCTRIAETHPTAVPGCTRE